MPRDAHDLERLVGEPLAALDHVGGSHQVRLAVDQRDVDDLRVEDLLDAIADEVVHRLHVEVPGQPALDVGDHRELGVALPGLLEQARVLERDAEAPRDRHEQANVGLAERVLVVEVLERDPPGGPVAEHEGDVDDGLRVRALDDGGVHLPRRVLEILVDDDRFPHRHGSTAEPSRRVGRLIGEPLAAFDGIREVQEPVGLVDHADVDDLGVEDLLDPVADEVVHRLHLEVLRKGALDVGDQPELGVALARLLEQTRVLERDRQAPRDRREEAGVVLPERALVVHVLQGDSTDRLAPDDQRHQQPGARRLIVTVAPERGAAEVGDLVRDVLVEQQRLGSTHHVLRDRARSDRFEVDPNALLARVRLVEEARAGVEDADVDHLRVEDLADPLADELVHRPHVEVLGEAVLDPGDDGELGVALLRLLEQARVLERDGQARGDRLEQPDVRVAERVLAVEVVEQTSRRCRGLRRASGRRPRTSTARRRWRPGCPLRCIVAPCPR